eukprot:784157-Pyramimonas_sp.AAC.1
MGRILELADALAADVGYRHALPDGYKAGCGVSVATASIDSLLINGREFSGVHDIWLTAYVTLVGRSSMEVSEITRTMPIHLTPWDVRASACETSDSAT